MTTEAPCGDPPTGKGYYTLTLPNSDLSRVVERLDELRDLVLQATDAPREIEQLCKVRDMLAQSLALAVARNEEVAAERDAWQRKHEERARERDTIIGAAETRNSEQQDQINALAAQRDRFRALAAAMHSAALVGVTRDVDPRDRGKVEDVAGLHTDREALRDLVERALRAAVHEVDPPPAEALPTAIEMWKKKALHLDEFCNRLRTELGAAHAAKQLAIDDLSTQLEQVTRERDEAIRRAEHASGLAARATRLLDVTTGELATRISSVETWADRELAAHEETKRELRAVEKLLDLSIGGPLWRLLRRFR
jgi:hypothetical protein